MNKTFNSKFEIVKKDLDEGVAIEYSATFRISPETKTEPEVWDLISVDFEVEYYPSWLPIQDIEGYVIAHAWDSLKSKKNTVFI